MSLTRTSLILLSLFTLCGAREALAVEAIHEINGQALPLELHLPFATIGDIARKNLDADPEDEILVSAGPGSPPYVALFDTDGTLMNAFLVYAETFDRGVNMAVGDVDGNGVDDLVVGTEYGGGPHVRVFYTDGSLQHEFFAYSEAFRGGVQVATADIDGDGTEEIITGPGITGGPHLRIFNQFGELKQQFFPFNEEHNGGLSITRVDENQDGLDELMVTERRSETAQLLHIAVSQPSAPIRVLALTEDTPADGYTLFPVDDTHIGVSHNGNKPAEVRVLAVDGTLTFLYENKEISQKNRLLSASTVGDIVSVSATSLLSPRNDQHIYVNLNEQRLYAYEDGLLQNTFLISAARAPWQTPTGEFSVMRKLRTHDYRWYYGENDPRNYELPDVEYNLEFTRHYYIHHAYWHNNWGIPMSHGCVNAPYDGVRWIYEWAQVGTPVIIE